MWAVYAVLAGFGALVWWESSSSSSTATPGPTPAPDNLFPTDDASTGSSYDSSASSPVARALSMVGLVPYQLDGDSPTTGFDCSGLVTWAYGLEKMTAGTLYSICTPISVSELRPGDLLFYAFDGGGVAGIDHVTMYVGDGDVVAAADPKDGVIRQPLYGLGFVGAGRLL